MKFEIWQVQSDKTREFGFIGLDFIIKHYGKVEKSNYNKVYQGTITESDNVLEDLFRIFNVEKPSDFKGHSLSVSDVIILDNDAFYCDSFGWSKIEF